MKVGPLERLSLERFQNPSLLDQSILMVWPQTSAVVEDSYRRQLVS